METTFTTLGYETLDPAEIEVSKRLRTVEVSYVDALKNSIKEKGQIQPIEVAQNPRRKGKAYVLVSGAHRLAACERLGININCTIVKFSGKISGFNTACRMREIDENLIRNDLNALDQAIFLHERKKIYEKLYPSTKQGGIRGNQYIGGKQNDTVSFSSDISRIMGVSKRKIERLCRIAENISPELREKIVGTKLANKQGELLALTKLGPTVQKKVFAALTRPENPAKSVMAATKEISGGKAKVGTVADDMIFKQLQTAFRKAPVATKRRFLLFLNETGEFKKMSGLST